MLPRSASHVAQVNYDRSFESGGGGYGCRHRHRAGHGAAIRACGCDGDRQRPPPGENGKTRFRLAERGRVVPIAADAGTLDGARAVRDAACATGDYAILVNNAGVGYSHAGEHPASMAILGETPPELWREVMRINLDSAYFLCHDALTVFLARGSGSIVNVSSAGGLKGMADAHTYATAKAGMINLTRSMAIAYGPKNIRCNVVAPGYVDTEMVHRSWVPRRIRSKTRQRAIRLHRSVARADLKRWLRRSFIWPSKAPTVTAPCWPSMVACSREVCPRDRNPAREGWCQAGAIASRKPAYDRGPS